MRQTLRCLILANLLLDFLNFVRNCTAAGGGNGTLPAKLRRIDQRKYLEHR
jgi:hypothetical protein